MYLKRKPSEMSLFFTHEMSIKMKPKVVFIFYFYCFFAQHSNCVSISLSFPKQTTATCALIIWLTEKTDPGLWFSGFGMFFRRSGSVLFHIQYQFIRHLNGSDFALKIAILLDQKKKLPVLRSGSYRWRISTQIMPFVSGLLSITRGSQGCPTLRQTTLI